jgi:hypothetical protein
MLLICLLECFMMVSMYNKPSKAGRFGLGKESIWRVTRLVSILYSAQVQMIE